MKNSTVSSKYFPIVSAIIACFFSLLVSAFFIHYYVRLVRDKQKSDMINCSDNINAQIYDSVMNSFSKVMSVSEMTKGIRVPERIPVPQLEGVMHNTDVFCIVFAPDNVISSVYPKEYGENAIGMDISTFFEKDASKITNKRISGPALEGPFQLPKSHIRAMASYIPVYFNGDKEPVFWGTVAVLVPYPEIFHGVNLRIAEDRHISLRVSILDEYTGEIYPFLQTIGPFPNEFVKDKLSTTKYYFTTPIQIDMVPQFRFYQSKTYVFFVISAVIISLLITAGVYSITNSFRRKQELEYYKVQARLVDVQSHVINSLSSLVENRDSDTGAHILRTSYYVYMIVKEAQKAGLYPEILTDEYCEMIKSAAPMHDIGKISVPDAVLKKPAKLNEEEFEQIKKHTVEGFEIIRSILGPVQTEEFITITQNIAVGHHEKWNGTGYPYGLAGEDIPLCARIMAIADVFDALTSPRCYKPPFSFEEAIEIIRNDSGTHFDPQLAEIFLQNQDRLRPMAAEAAKNVISIH